MDYCIFLSCKIFRRRAVCTQKTGILRWNSKYCDPIIKKCYKGGDKAPARKSVKYLTFNGLNCWHGGDYNEKEKII